MVVLASLAAWLLFVTWLVGGSAVLSILLILGFVLVALLSSAVTRVHAWAMPAGLALVAGLVLLLKANGLSPGSLNYSNAFASFFGLAAAAALMVVFRAQRVVIRIAAGVALIGFAFVPVIADSVTAIATTLMLPLAVLAAYGRRGVRVLIVASAAAVVGMLIATSAIGLTYESDNRTHPAEVMFDSLLSERRAALWNDALAIMAGEPVTGVGPGNFVQHSRTARADGDARWAHNEYLQIGAESGVVGLVLILGAVLTGFAWLWRGRCDAGSAAAAIGFAAFAIHGTVDYVWHFPEVTLAAAVLLGAGAVAPVYREAA